MALSKTGRFLSKAEILGVGVFSPLSIKIGGHLDEHLDVEFVLVMVFVFFCSTKASQCHSHNLCELGSRLSFLLQNPRTPEGFQKGYEGFTKGSVKGSLKGFGRVFEGVSRKTLQNPFGRPSRTLRKPFKKVSKS